MNIIEQSENMLLLAQRLVDFCSFHFAELGGFYPSVIGSSDEKPTVHLNVDTLAEAKRRALLLEPDTSKWTMTRGAVTTFHAERMGVVIEIWATERTPDQPAEFPE